MHEPIRLEGTHQEVAKPPELEPPDSLWQEMVKDLHVLMHHPVDDPERNAWLEETLQEIKSYGGFDLGPMSMENVLWGVVERPIVDREIFLKGKLERLKKDFTLIDNSIREFHLSITTGDKNPHCVWRSNGDTTEIDFDIYVGRTDHHYAQEELFHAAQEILFESFDKATSSMKKTSEQLVHTSVVLDMAMSLAAKQEGTWADWNRKANDLQQAEREHFLRTMTWERTLLGKSLNKRFQYQDMSLADVGRYWKNLGTYFAMMFDKVRGMTNHEMVEVYEFGCLALGTIHRDLSYWMLDLDIDESMSDEDAGRVVVEWAKKILELYSGTEHEQELLGHHSDVKKIPDDYFHYEVPEDTLAELVSAAASTTETLDEHINITTLKDMSAANWQKKVDEIMAAWHVFQTDHQYLKLNQVLEACQLPKKVFDELVARSHASYLRQFQDHDEYSFFGFGMDSSAPSSHVFQERDHLDPDAEFADTEFEDDPDEPI